MYISNKKTRDIVVNMASGYDPDSLCYSSGNPSLYDADYIGEDTYNTLVAKDTATNSSKNVPFKLGLFSCDLDHYDATEDCYCWDFLQQIYSLPEYKIWKAHNTTTGKWTDLDLRIKLKDVHICLKTTPANAYSTVINLSSKGLNSYVGFHVVNNTIVGVDNALDALQYYAFASVDGLGNYNPNYLNVDTRGYTDAIEEKRITKGYTTEGGTSYLPDYPKLDVDLASTEVCTPTYLADVYSDCTGGIIDTTYANLRTNLIEIQNGTSTTYINDNIAYNQNPQYDGTGLLNGKLNQPYKNCDKDYTANQSLVGAHLEGAGIYIIKIPMVYYKTVDANSSEYKYKINYYADVTILMFTIQKQIEHTQFVWFMDVQWNEGRDGMLAERKATFSNDSLAYTPILYFPMIDNVNYTLDNYNNYYKTKILNGTSLAYVNYACKQMSGDVLIQNNKHDDNLLESTERFSYYVRPLENRLVIPSELVTSLKSSDQDSSDSQDKIVALCGYSAFQGTIEI